MNEPGCPRCGHGELYEIDEVRQADHASANATYPLTLMALWRGTGDRGFLGGERHERIEVPVSATVCARCANVELVVRDLDSLARLAAMPNSGVRRVTG